MKYLQLCLPRKLVPEILKVSHDLPTSCHLGVRRMTDQIRRRFYWKGWQRDVDNHCKTCQKCGERNPPSRKARAPLQIDNTGYPMQRVAMDIVGPLPSTERGNRYILVVVDYFTKWPEAFAIQNQETRTVAQKLVDEWVSRYGVMQQLHSDQGKNFASETFKELTDILGVKTTQTSPFHPQGDGMVERLNRTLKDMLSRVINEKQKDWDVWIPQALLAYGTTMHTATGLSPHYMMFEGEARCRSDLWLPEPQKVSSTNHQ